MARIWLPGRGQRSGRRVISVMRLPQIDPPFTDSTRDACMMRPISWPARIASQVLPAP
jgi:hypothetical protein